MVTEWPPIGKIAVHSTYDTLADDSSKDALRQTIFQLESSIQDQLCIDNAYNEFCNVIKINMEDKLEKKTIKIEHGSSNKKRRLNKPWWN